MWAAPSAWTELQKKYFKHKVTHVLKSGKCKCFNLFPAVNVGSELVCVTLLCCYFVQISPEKDIDLNAPSCLNEGQIK